MKPLRIADLRDKVSLKRAVVTVDSELNRIETLETTKVVWASVEVSSATIDNTDAGHKDVLKYKITIRKQSIECDYIEYKGRLLIPTAPWYSVDNKYIVIEAQDEVTNIT